MNGNRQVFAASDRTHKKQVNFKYGPIFLLSKWFFLQFFLRICQEYIALVLDNAWRKSPMKLHLLVIGFSIIWLTFFSFRSICFCCNRLWSSLSRSDSSPDDQFRIGGVTTVGGAGSKTATPKIVVKQEQELVRNHLVNYFCTVPHRQHAHNCSIFPSNRT